MTVILEEVTLKTGTELVLKINCIIFEYVRQKKLKISASSNIIHHCQITVD